MKMMETYITGRRYVDACHLTKTECQQIIERAQLDQDTMQ
jgi:hypothetical protein